MFKGVSINDEIHGKVPIIGDDAELVWHLTQTKEMQRPQHIKQLGLVQLLEPSKTHTRYSHSLGAYHIGNRMLEILQERSPEKFDQMRAGVVRAALILHDIGHGPYSHVFERIFDIDVKDKPKSHEEWSCDIILSPQTEVNKVLTAADPSGKLARDVAEMVSSKTPKDIYASIVSSQLDADRLDYLIRDAKGTDKPIGFDWVTLLQELDVRWVKNNGDRTKREKHLAFVLNTDQLTQVQSYLETRFDGYKAIYQHTPKVAVEGHLECVLWQLVQNLDAHKPEDFGLMVDEPMVLYLKNQGRVDMDTYLELDDATIWHGLKRVARHGENVDKNMAEAARRLVHNKPFVGVDVYRYVEDKTPSDELDQFVKDWAEENGLEYGVNFKTVTQGKQGYKYITNPQDASLRILAWNEQKQEICDIYDMSERVRVMAKKPQMCVAVLPNDEMRAKLIDALRSFKPKASNDNTRDGHKGKGIRALFPDA